MPRDGSGIYSQPFPDVVEGTTIESAVYNGFTNDVAFDLNWPRPILAGGTGAASADEALDNLKAEKFKQVVTNWDTTVWRAGSFYAATTAIGIAPVTGHAFAGIVYYANATDLVVEATDVTDPLNTAKYIRVMTAGVWGNWILASGSAGAAGDYTFDNTLTYPPASGQIRFNNATQNSTTELFISHTTALGVENAGVISTSIKAGNDILVQDKDEPTKYKIFTARANPVLSGSDFRVSVGVKSAGVDIVSAQRVLISASAGIAIAKKNYIINGAMQISQENGTTVATIIGGNMYAVDQFTITATGQTGTISYAQVASLTPGGSPNRIRFTATVADASVAAGDAVYAGTPLEGLRIADLKAGTAQAKTITIQFGVKAPAGTYCVAIRNNAVNRNYVAEYVIAAGEANTDVVKSVTVALDQIGTWPVDNTAGMYISWTLMSGANWQATANTWAAGNLAGTVNQFNFMGTINNVFELFDVSLTEGTVAPPFQVPDYPSELEACRRYWRYMSPQIVDTSSASQSTPIAPAMRNTPTFLGGGAGFTIGGASSSSFWVFQTTRASTTLMLNARL